LAERVDIFRRKGELEVQETFDGKDMPRRSSNCYKWFPQFGGGVVVGGGVGGGGGGRRVGGGDGSFQGEVLTPLPPKGGLGLISQQDSLFLLKGGIEILSFRPRREALLLLEKKKTPPREKKRSFASGRKKSPVDDTVT